MGVTGRCIALLGGSFDPVHNGHVALGKYFATLLAPDELRVIPAGKPWQKNGLQASPEHRVAMVKLAFDRLPVPVVVDPLEILRGSPTYTIDTLRAVREELGPEVSLAFLIGADQLQQLHTWKEWRQLFDYAHICAASRPGFAMDSAHVPAEVGREFARRDATPQQIRETSHGLTTIATNLAVDISATHIRAALERGERADALIPPGVLDYIKQHHLYT
ncbi:nicotinate-nucleotide adenylyltransferase [Noviherbaspirillum sp.]|uniref:nicotinate-nucleotide adenylyltransferase n=1 Tax=Noviherbaspirillum sp. TaxID=1926288 RepID=UPI002B4658B6|nr:nicotinate-nucleotide adenylyltransferase [Noviherbaspirillum sp.]HJV79504.1 nicotinate-nucleotide adenylyltransferase [Noviherbaspirillum sp.]